MSTPGGMNFYIFAISSCIFGRMVLKCLSALIRILTIFIRASNNDYFVLADVSSDV